MKFIDDIRRENLKTLAASMGGVAALAKKLGRSESQISQWTTGALLPSGRRRGMKSDSARWIERVTGKPEGWLDQDHSERAEPREITALIDAIRRRSGEGTFPLDVAEQMRGMVEAISKKP